MHVLSSNFAVALATGTAIRRQCQVGQEAKLGLMKVSNFPSFEFSGYLGCSTVAKIVSAY